MRIIAGRLGGRSFDAPHNTKTHPMSEKMRGAIFNALGDIEGLSVLDAYAGSGALSFEALSRGVAHVMAIELDKDAVKTILRNCQLLAVSDSIDVLRANTAAWSKRTITKRFNLVLLDPPYDDIRPDVLWRLAQRCEPGGLVVMSLPPGAKLRVATGYDLINTKSHGDATLWFYRHTAQTLQ